MDTAYVVCSDCSICQKENLLNVGLVQERKANSLEPILYTIQCRHGEHSYTTTNIFLREKTDDEIKAWGTPVTTIRWVSG